VAPIRRHVRPRFREATFTTMNMFSAAVRRLSPGVLLCIAVTIGASLLQDAEVRLFGRAWLETLVLAILLGTAVRTAWQPHRSFRPGIVFSAKFLLELAVLLLGAAVSVQALAAISPELIGAVIGVVVLAIAASYTIARALRLSPRLSILIACGNSICGNSAIAALAPVIGADAEDIAASIAFTAVLGVIVVLALPLLATLLGLSSARFGVLAGLTVYAVPQVLAATHPAGAVAVQIGTMVKLVRVLMLAPLVLAFSLASRPLREEIAEPAPAPAPAGARGMPPLHRLLPWFILGFLGLAALRAAGLVPHVVLAPAANAADTLTVISMAALGLGVDIRVVAKAGLRVTLAVTLSLLTLGAIALAAIDLADPA
jgi:uncharacterized integral membrane protein (TIGR00698 family)